FSNAMLSTSSIMLGANTFTGAFDSRTNSQSLIKSLFPSVVSIGGDITSLGSVTLDASAGRVTVGGSITVPSTGTNVISGISQPTVNRYITSYGTQNGAFAASGSQSNVLGAAQLAGTYAPDYSRSGNIETSLPAVSITSTTVAPAPAFPTDSQGQQLSQTGSTTTVSRGDYAMDSMTVSSSTNLTVGSGTQPVRIFIDPGAGQANSATQVVNINGNVNAGGLPADFQIFYNGSGILNIASPTMAATIYAPNATVLLGNSKGGRAYTFSGSVVANQIGGSLDTSTGSPVLKPTTNLRFHYDAALGSASTSTNGAIKSLTYDPTAYTNPSYYQVASYSELLRSH
ncbi:MAG TPA: hypothetical protein V6C72_11025, partial [Chroococcales cyanobacterium]